MNLPRPLVSGLAQRVEQLRALLAPDFLAQYRDLDPCQELFERIQGQAQLPGREYPKQIVYVWLKTYFANYHMAADRLDMAHSVEVRLPFLDHVLFEYVSQLPVAVLNQPNREKALLRDVARPHIPEWIYQRTKQPFLAPPTVPQADGPLYSFVQSVLRSESARSMPFLNHAGVRQLLDTLPTAPPQERLMLDHFVIMLTSLCVLHETFHF
jgi:asparagine synthase (glutamine-hydrolysing)